MTCTTYDEDLEMNPFFVAFKTQERTLFENFLKKDWIITVPRSKSFIKQKYEDFDFLNHILVPLLDESSSTNDACYKTLGNQKIAIHGRTIVVYSKDCDSTKKIQILFDETFYTDDRPYQVLCVSEPFHSENFEHEQTSANGVVFTLNSVEDSKTFLWKFLAKRNTKAKVDALIAISKSEISKIEPPSIERCIAVMKNLYTSSHQIITSHRSYMRLASKTENLNNSLNLALSMYLSHCMHTVLFAVLTDVTAQRDEEVNRATRIFQYIRASKSGIRFDMCENVPKARKELNSIRRITTPLDICECIRKVIAELSSFRRQSIILPFLSTSTSTVTDNEPDMSPTLINTSQSSLMVTSDDLLSALIFLVIKSDIPNWYTYLEYAINFRFASCSRDDEYQYYLTTLEATLEHVRGMALNTVEEDNVMDISSNISMTSPDSSTSNWTDIMQSSISSSRAGVVAYELNQIRQLFKLIESGQTSSVKDILMRSNRVDGMPTTSRRTVGPSNFIDNRSTDHYCHPLCSCTAFMSERKSCQSLIEGSKISVDNKIIPESKTFDTFESSQRRYSVKSAPSKEQGSPASGLGLSSVDDRGWTALHMASYCDQLEIVNILISFGASVNAVTLENETSLHLAAQRGHQNIIFKLLDSGANINLRNCSGHTALHLATEYGHSSCVSTLIYFGTLQSNLEINSVNNVGNTALHIAARWGFESIVKHLLDNDASAILKNSKGYLPCDIASTRKLTQMIKIKGQKEELLSVTNEKYATIAITNKSTHGQFDTMKMPKKINNYSSLKVKAIEKFHSQIQKDSLNSNVMNSSYEVLTKKVEKLLKVVADGDLEMLKFLLELNDEDIIASKPIDLNRRLCHPLCQCNECHPVQEIMIKSNNKEFNINSTNREGFHALHIAAIHDRSTIAKFLLHHGAEPNVKTIKLELTPLHLAAIYGSIKVSTILLNKEVDVNVTDKKKNTALIYACTKGKFETAEILIEAGASVNVANYRGNSPLHEAVRNNHVNIIELLIKHGANTTVTNDKGLMAIDLSKQLDTYLLLKKAIDGAKSGDRKNNDDVDAGESGMVSINSSYYRDNVYNVENDNMSLCSEISIDSTTDHNFNEIDSRALFPDDLKFDFNSIIGPESCNSTVTEIDENLLERVDRNSKYNYRLTFKDPNSPSISSTNSSK